MVGLMKWELEKTGDVKVRATGKTGNLFHDWIFFFISLEKNISGQFGWIKSPGYDSHKHLKTASARRQRQFAP